MKLTRKRMSLVVLGLAIGCFFILLDGICKQSAGEPARIVRPIASLFLAMPMHTPPRPDFLLKAVMLSSGYTIRRQPWNSAERQPLVVPLQRRDGRIVLPDMPPVVLSDADKTEMTPKIGDIAFDTTTQELVIFCQPEDTVSTLIPVGHVIGGMNYLLQTDGDFAGYLMNE